MAAIERVDKYRCLLCGREFSSAEEVVKHRERGECKKQLAQGEAGRAL